MSADTLRGRRIIITGGASGMGEGLVRAFPAYGATVVSMDLDAVAGEAVAAAAGALAFLPVDVCDAVSVRNAVDAAVARMGGLDVLIHAAGVAPSARAEDMSLDFWNRVIAVNATGTMLMNQAVFPHLKSAGGAILNFASAAGVNGHPGKAAYAAAKGAVLSWNRSIAAEWASHRITVNAIAPAIWTPMYDKTRSEMSAEDLALHDAQKLRAIPLGGKLGDVARDFTPVMTFLASEGARFMTGQIIAIDGGMVMSR
ncbi:MAG: SDR family oxidoreductase [Caulobacter sp.]|nr:SDR family oxidoreductase [Caulobacter sp.]